MLRIGIAFLAGHGVIHLLPALPSAQPWGWIVACALALMLALRSRIGLAFASGIDPRVVSRHSAACG